MSIDSIRLKAEIYRHGMHDLMPYWSPDDDRMHDPFKNHEVQKSILAFVRKVLNGDFEHNNSDLRSND